MDDKLPRQRWRYGRISKLLDSHDCLVRGASVTVNSNGRLHEMRRPICKLIPIELSVDREEYGNLTNDGVDLTFVDDRDVVSFQKDLEDKLPLVRFVGDDEPYVVKVIS